MKLLKLVMKEIRLNQNIKLKKLIQFCNGSI